MPERTAERIARGFYRQQQITARQAGKAAQRIWGSVTIGALDEAWRASGPQLVRVMSAGQQQAAAPADAYVGSTLTADGGDSQPAGQLDVSAFVGRSADGRSLTSLLYEPWIETRWRLANGQSGPESLQGGLATLIRQFGTEIPDAGREAVGASLAGNKAAGGYVRVLTPPSCARCVVLAGKHYKYSAGFQRHPHCFPAGVVVSGPQALAATRRRYEGELTVIRTASGEQLPATGNHPILTDRGWVPANLIQEGDYVVRSTRSQGATALVVPHEDQVPARIEDCWRPDGVMPLLQMPTSAEDFHGDGGHGDVDVVLADGLLRNWGQVAGGQFAEQEEFAWRIAQALGFAQYGPLQQLLYGLLGAAYGVMGGFGLGLALLGSEALGAYLSGFGHAANFNTGRFQSRTYGAAGESEAIAQAVLALSGAVGGHDLVGRNVADLQRWDAPADPFAAENRGAYAARGADLVRRLSGQVEPDRVVEVRSTSWSGHVYNLTSSEGWYSANGLIVSNCDCVHLPVGHLGDALVLDPGEYFRGLSKAEQDRLFTLAGAQAIRDGADISAVVNARRGMYTAEAYGQRLASTYDSTTRRGQFFRAERQRAIDRGLIPPSGRGHLKVPRLLPEEIYKRAGSREELIAMLRRYGYIR